MKGRGWLLAALLLLPVLAAAGERAAADELSLYYARGVDSDLPELAPKAVRGELVWEDSRFAGAGWLHLLGTPGWLQAGFDALRLPNTRLGAELVLVQHRGRQRNAEIAAALALRFATLAAGPLTARFGLSLGLSQALGTPSYEDGPLDDPARRYRLQNYNAYELALGHRGLPRWSLVARVHHRSGAYGLIAPRHVGSNFLALGLRVAL